METAKVNGNTPVFAGLRTRCQHPVYFTSQVDGTPHIWRIKLDGTGLKQITAGDFADFTPHVSSDGKWVLFTSWRSGIQLLWKVPSEGGEAVQVTNVPSQRGAFSPYGKHVAAIYLTPNSRFQVSQVGRLKGGGGHLPSDI